MQEQRYLDLVFYSSTVLSNCIKEPIGNFQMFHHSFTATQLPVTRRNIVQWFGEIFFGIVGRKL